MSLRQTRRRPNYTPGRRTVITDDNIRMLVSDYIDNRESLPDDLREIPIGNWNVSRVTNMDSLFALKTTFNEPLNDWNVSNVESMDSMFYRAYSFNQPLDRWNVSNVETMIDMFDNATSFNQDIGNWNVSNVESMNGMFTDATSFNQDLSAWNVSTVENFSSMFQDATNFNINPHWNIRRGADTENMFTGSGVVPPPPPARQTRGRRGRAPAAAPMPPPPPPAAAPEGVAYEIHNAFDNFKFDKFMEIIRREITANPPAPGILPLFENPDNILYPIIAYTFKQTGLTQEAKEEKIRQLNLIQRTIESYEGIAANRQKIIDVLKFVMTQPKEFIDTYIQILLTDCLKAYSTGRQQSCIKGMYERVFFSIRDTIATMCLDQMQGTGPAPLCKPVYIELFECFYEVWPKEGPGGLNEMLGEWYGDGAAVSALSPENRIENFVNFVRAKIEDSARFRQAEASIRKYAREDLNAMFGGKRHRRSKRSIKKRSNKKSIKKRSTKKRKY